MSNFKAIESLLTHISQLGDIARYDAKTSYGLMKNRCPEEYVYNRLVLTHSTVWAARIFLGTSWWRHRMETFSASLALCAGNSPVTGEFPSQRPVTPSFDVFFDLRLNGPLNKQSWGWWLETPWRSLWRHCNVQRMPSLYCAVCFACVLTRGDVAQIIGGAIEARVFDASDYMIPNWILAMNIKLAVKICSIICHKVVLFDFKLWHRLPSDWYPVISVKTSLWWVHLRIQDVNSVTIMPCHSTC